MFKLSLLLKLFFITWITDPDPNEKYVMENGYIGSQTCDSCSSTLDLTYDNQRDKYICQCTIGYKTTSPPSSITCQNTGCPTYSTTGCFSYCSNENYYPSGCPGIGSSPDGCYNSQFSCCNFDTQNRSRIIHCNENKVVDYTICDVNKKCNVDTGICENVANVIEINFSLIFCIFWIFFVTL